MIKTSSEPSAAGVVVGAGRTIRRCFAPAPPDSARAGALRSSAQASRCRATGRCASQQLTVQNARPVRFWLHVDTLQTQYVAPNAIGLLHELQRRQAEESFMERANRTELDA